MTPADFANAVAREKSDQVKLHFAPDVNTEVAGLIQALDLNPEEREALRVVMETALRDFAYTLLLGLDGAASIGGMQKTYRLLDEEGHDLAGGKLEVAAWQALQAM
jgi:hypothetical protein